MGTTPAGNRGSGIWQAWPGWASARRRSGLGLDRGVQPPGHCAVHHSADGHQVPAVGQSLVMGVGGDHGEQKSIRPS